MKNIRENVLSMSREEFTFLGTLSKVLHIMVADLWRYLVLMFLLTGIYVLFIRPYMPEQLIRPNSGMETFLILCGVMVVIVCIGYLWAIVRVLRKEKI